MSELDSKLTDLSATAGSAPPTPDAKTRQVPDEMAKLRAKPSEHLSPPEARRQPMPADAVKSLLKNAEIVAD